MPVELTDSAKKKLAAAKRAKRVRAGDVPGTGQARRAADSVERRKQKNRSALEMAREGLGVRSRRR